MENNALLESLKKAVEQNPRDAALRLHYVRMLLEELGKVKADEKGEKLTPYRPLDIPCSVPPGVPFLEKEEPSKSDVSDEAAIQLQTALSNDTSLSDEILELAKECAEKENFHSVKLCLEAVLDHGALLSPQELTAYRLMADAFHALGDKERATEYTKRADELSTSLGITPPGQKKVVPIALNQGQDITTINAVPFEKVDVTFRDVGGMENLKEEIKMKIVYPLFHQELFSSYGKMAGGGILLYGPPGCGKTHLARATAGECGAAFISVSLNDILDMWHGNTEKNIHAIFDAARKNTPAIIFFDELEAVGGNRLGMREHYQRMMTDQLLMEMDGIHSKNERVLVLAATNAPWHIDAALRRPGRFDEVLFVSCPDLKARESILRIHLRGKPVSDDVSVPWLAEHTNYFSGADLKRLVEKACELKLRDAMKRGKPEKIDMRTFKTALNQLKPSCVEWFETAKNYARYANESGYYDPILTHCEEEHGNLH